MKSDLKIFKTGINKSKNLSDIRRDDKKIKLLEVDFHVLILSKLKRLVTHI